ncbi:hypothetical protein ACTA71_010161 [Dictyostelium dimigraforme]
MQIFRPRKASELELTNFHSDDSINFLKLVTPDNMHDYSKQLVKCNLVREDCPVFDGMYNFCQISSGGSIGSAFKVNSKESDSIEKSTNLNNNNNNNNSNRDSNRWILIGCCASSGLSTSLSVSLCLSTTGAVSSGPSNTHAASSVSSLTRAASCTNTHAVSSDQQADSNYYPLFRSKNVEMISKWKNLSKIKDW